MTAKLASFPLGSQAQNKQRWCDPAGKCKKRGKSA